MAVNLKHILARAKAKQSAGNGTSAARAAASAPSGEDEKNATTMESFLKMDMPLESVVSLPDDWSSRYRCGSIPTVYYIPDFITEDDEKRMLQMTYQVPGSKWTNLKRRRLQNWGGNPRANGMIQEPLAKWLEVICEKLLSLNVFPKKPNHVLLNEYKAGEGIMAHTDGPLYFPRVAILSLGSTTVMNFYHNLVHTKTGEIAASLLLRPRSLLIFQDDMYSKLFHEIQELPDDEIRDHVINGTLAHTAAGDTYSRSTRVSLTIRIVPTVEHNASPTAKFGTSATDAVT